MVGRGMASRSPSDHATLHERLQGPTTPTIPPLWPALARASAGQLSPDFGDRGRHRRRTLAVTQPRTPPQVPRSCPASRVALDRGGRGAGVAAAELDGVHHERGDLVERDPISPSVGEREDLLVGGEAVVAEAAEQPHHGEVELAVAAVGGRVDQPAAPVGVDDAVAGPEITVQPSRGLDLATDVGEPANERL